MLEIALAGVILLLIIILLDRRFDGINTKLETIIANQKASVIVRGDTLDSLDLCEWPACEEGECSEACQQQAQAAPRRHG